MAVTLNASTTTGLVQSADTSGIIELQSNGTTAVTIDTSQRVLIGATSASGFDSGADNLIVGAGSGSNGITIYSGNTSTAGINFADGTTGSAIYAGGITYNHNTNNLDFSTTDGSGRMRIDTSGKLLVGTTSLTNSNDSGGVFWSSATGSGGEGGFEFRNTSTSTNSDANPTLVIYKGSTTYTSSQRFIQFNANAGSQAMGGIVGNGATNVQFISLSDAREKDNIVSITGSLDKVVSLNPVEFDWKKTGEHIKAGFIAQEVEAVFPEYVVDNVANAGEEERKGLTGGMSAGFIAHLVSSIKELNAKVDAQAVRIAELEGAK